MEIEEEDDDEYLEQDDLEYMDEEESFTKVMEKSPCGEEWLS